MDPPTGGVCAVSGRSPLAAWVRGKDAAPSPVPRLQSSYGLGEGIVLRRTASVPTEQSRRSRLLHRLLPAAATAAACVVAATAATLHCDPERLLSDSAAALRKRVHSLLVQEAGREERLQQTAAALRAHLSRGSPRLSCRSSPAPARRESALTSVASTPARYRPPPPPPPPPLCSNADRDALAAAALKRSSGLMSPPAGRPRPAPAVDRKLPSQCASMSPVRHSSPDLTEQRLAALEQRLDAVAAALVSPARAGARWSAADALPDDVWRASAP
eukprot:TRINITY_DN4928_c0_g1_i1.p1 TRINITY_DN4928_c0_g1~~TRINITY_DN4928_c0_g1_i1.p1  ORF type:complete len:286 (+),score=89.69 TRINITY_DN4928_c0_g1_i1:40-858(+)